MRVALLSYRSKPHCGGQGVYVRHLSRELVALGHDVEVFSGQPYPELDEGCGSRRSPASTSTGSPTCSARRGRASTATWSTCSRSRPCGPPASPSRAPSASAGRPAALERLADFDVVHDNQTLGYGMLDIERAASAGDDHPPPDHLRPQGGPRRGQGHPQAAGRCAGGTAS